MAATTVLGWRREIEPKFIPTHWNTFEDLVVVFNCCSYPVFIGKISKKDQRLGFKHIKCMPSKCPCKCRHRLNNFRAPTDVISPTNLKLRIEFHIESSGTFSNVVVYLENYWAETCVEEEEEQI